MSTVSNSREQLRALVDELPDELLPDAISALTHLEVDDEPLSEEEIANLEASREDFKHGRVISLEKYERNRAATRGSGFFSWTPPPVVASRLAQTTEPPEDGCGLKPDPTRNRLADKHRL